MEETLPERDYPFPAAPDMLFPLYFAFFGLRSLASFRTGVMDSGLVTAVLLEGKQGRRLILANPKVIPVQIRIVNDIAAATVRAFVMDQDHVAQMAQKENFSVTDQAWYDLDLTKPVVLKPYAFLIAEFLDD
ncbi:hypothetical protein [Clostridium sp. AM58-1XD]|uniref:hypothetical protein n=1 Tax=Clostridium sp. AM58-1XD TaxID=2292307 RepID=UPI000E489AD2|nr:hypothetical protein [Clostridium sp. AM58-1XD]RGY99254.1 hypothetical protein DXA13_08520 [Clostridium sp. AM58-1XD]